MPKLEMHSSQAHLGYPLLPTLPYSINGVCSTASMQRAFNAHCFALSSTQYRDPQTHSLKPSCSCSSLLHIDGRYSSPYQASGIRNQEGNS